LRDVSKNTQISNFFENPSIGSRVVPCGGTDGLTDMTKLKPLFPVFERAPMKEIRIYHLRSAWK